VCRISSVTRWSVLVCAAMHTTAKESFCTEREQCGCLPMRDFGGIRCGYVCIAVARARSADRDKEGVIVLLMDDARRGTRSLC
jgi:hypothetical protein